MASRINSITLFSWQRMLPYILLLGGVIGLIASFALTYDTLQVLKDPSYTPACSINPIISCGSVMRTESATIVAGVPNSLFGIAAFSGLCAFAAMLLAGAQVKPWLWRCANAVALLGVIAMHYLFYQAVFVIGSICPWCFAVWMVTIPVFWGITVTNIRAGYYDRPTWPWFAIALKIIQRNAAIILAAWYVSIFA